MGIFDTIHAFVRCPFCNAKNEVHCQTKAYYSWFYNYEIGDKLRGGPYMDGDYGPSEKECDSCNSTYFVLWHVRNNFIDDINSFKENELKKSSGSHQASLFNPDPYNKEILFDKIIQTSIELLRNLDNDELKQLSTWINWERFDFYVDLTTHPYQEISRVLNYLIMLYRNSDSYINDCKKIIKELKTEYCEEYYNDIVNENKFNVPQIRLNKLHSIWENEIQYLGEFLLESANKIKEKFDK